MSPEEAGAGKQASHAISGGAPLRGLLGSLNQQAQALAVLSREKFEKWSKSPADTPRRQDRLAKDLQRLATSCRGLVATFDEAVRCAVTLSRRPSDLSPDVEAVISIVGQLRRLQFRELAVQLCRLFTEQFNRCRQPLDSADAQEILTKFLEVLPATEIVANQLTEVLLQLDEAAPPDEYVRTGNNQPLLSDVARVRTSLGGFLQEASKQLVDSLSPRPGEKGGSGLKRAAAAFSDYRESLSVAAADLERYGPGVRQTTEEDGRTWEYQTALRRLRVHEQTVRGMLTVLDGVYGSVFQIPLEAPVVAESLADMFAQLRVDMHDLGDLLDDYEASGAATELESASPAALPPWAELSVEQQRCVGVFFECSSPQSRGEVQQRIAGTSLGPMHLDTIRNWLISLEGMRICQTHKPDRKRGERCNRFSLTAAAREKYAAEDIKPDSK